MQKVTDSLYIQKNDIVSHILIVTDISGGGYKIVLKLSGQTDRVTLHTSSSIDVLISRLRTIATRLNLRRLTETLYIHCNMRVRLVTILNGYITIIVGENEVLDGWPTYLCPEDAALMASEIAAQESSTNDANIIRS